jgi:hypothetical protein
LKKGEAIEWIIEDKAHVVVRRPHVDPAPKPETSAARGKKPEAIPTSAPDNGSPGKGLVNESSPPHEKTPFNRLGTHGIEQYVVSADGASPYEWE